MSVKRTPRMMASEVGKLAALTLGPFASGAPKFWMNINPKGLRERYRLISEFLIDDVEQRLTVAEPLKLGDEKLHGLLEPVGRIVGAMRRK